jgi:hypothetical protein
MASPSPDTAYSTSISSSGRTITYSVVVAVLVGLYLGGVFVLQRLFFSGAPSWAVAGTTLAVAALFNPLRRRVQRAVDRRFNRSQYDPVQVADELTGHLTDDLNVHQIQAELVHAAVLAFEPAAIGVWTKGDDDEDSNTMNGGRSWAPVSS